MNKIDKYLKNISEKHPDRVLDIGAGDCEVASYFTEKGSEVDVLEPEPGERCKNKEINLHKQKVEDYNIPANAYDLVIMRSVIHFIEPKTLFKNVLPKVEESLKSQGFLYIRTMTPPEDSPRFTHTPADISELLGSLDLYRSDENQTKEEINGEEFTHTTWTLVYRKINNSTR